MRCNGNQTIFPRCATVGELCLIGLTRILIVMMMMFSVDCGGFAKMIEIENNQNCLQTISTSNLNSYFSEVCYR